MDIKIPFLGDGIESANILSIGVQPGDTVAVDDVILELETDKAVAPVPATSAGTVDSISVAVGDVVREGQVIGQLSGGSTGATAPAVAGAAPAAPVAPVAVAPSVSVPQAPVPPAVVAQPVGDASAVVTSPWIRSLCTQIGLDLARVVPTGRGGRVVLDDIRRYVAQLQQPVAAAPVQSESKPVAESMPDFSKWGPVESETVSSLRVKIADKMSSAWRIPHVTQFHEVDITQPMGLRKQWNDKYKKKGANLTVTAMAVKAAVSALQAFPAFNASFDGKQLVKKAYYHIGIAVDTPSGLIVPVIRDADQLSLFELAVQIGVVADKARDRTLTAADLQGGTFTISNLGGLGVGPFTPIINTPEVAILGLGRGVKRPIVTAEGDIGVGLMQPLALSYDHRVIDGADGARFMTHLSDALANLEEAAVKESL
jgi:pyruvate dehydrogenase E2 component (dihydrolipoamide acetyltransferase)